MSRPSFPTLLTICLTMLIIVSDCALLTDTNKWIQIPLAPNEQTVDPRKGPFSEFSFPPPQRAAAMMMFEGNDVTFDLAMFGGTLYVRDFNDVWEFNADRSTWIMSPRRGQIPERAYAFYWRFNNTLFVYGGVSVLKGIQDDLWKFDFTTNLWTMRSWDGEFDPGPRKGGISFLMDTDPCLHAGDGHDEVFTDIWCMDMDTTTWISTDYPPNATQPVPSASLSGGYHADSQRLYVYDVSKQLLKYYDFNASVWVNVVMKGTVGNWPYPRTLHGFSVAGDFLYIACGAYTGDGSPLNDIWKLNMLNASWLNIYPYNPYDPSLSPRTTVSLVAFSHRAIALFGGLRAAPMNDFFIIRDYAGDGVSPWVPWSPFPDQDVPRGRSYHTVVSWNSNLIMFGGQYYGTATSGVWKLNLTTYTWTELSITTTPTRRFGHSMCYVDDTLIVFAGQSTLSVTSVMNDMWQLPLNTGGKYSWVSITPSSTAPEARSFMGYSITTVNPLMYIYGGGTASTVLSDFWSFDMLKMAWTLIGYISLPGPRDKCAMATNETHLMLLGGITPKLIMDDTMWIFDITRQSWTKLDSRLPVMTPAILTIRQNPMHVLIVGGERNGILDPYGGHMYVVNENGLQNITTNTPKRTGAALVQIGDYVFLLGGLFPSDNGDTTVENAVNDLFYFQIEPICRYGMGSTCFGCPPGTYASNSVCMECEPGYYNDEWGLEKCKECGVGTYTPVFGVVTKSNCLSCNAGYYTDDPSSTECMKCPTQVIDVCSGTDENQCQCLVGSSGPIVKQIRNSDVTYADYALNAKDPAEANYIIDIDYYVLAACIFITVGCYILIRFGNFKLAKQLRVIDFFMADVHVSKDMFTRRVPSSGGGLCTILIFLVIGAVFVGVSSVPAISYSQELRTQVPRTIVSGEVFGVFRVRVILLNHDGECTSGATCSSEFYFSSTNLNIVQLQTPVCVQTPTQCTIEWTCTRCAPTANSLNLTFLAAGSISASAIRWEVMAQSAHGTESIVSSTVYPSSADDGLSVIPVFRGVGKPTMIYNNLMLNVARTSKNSMESPLVGYVVHHRNVEEGKAFAGGTITDDGLMVVFAFTFSQSVVLDSTDKKYYDAFLVLLYLGTPPGVITFLTLMFRLTERIMFSCLRIKSKHDSVVHIDQDSYNPVEDYDDENAVLIIKDEDMIEDDLNPQPLPRRRESDPDGEELDDLSLDRDEPGSQVSH